MEVQLGRKESFSVKLSRKQLGAQCQCVIGIGVLYDPFVVQLCRVNKTNSVPRRKECCSGAAKTASVRVTEEEAFRSMLFCSTFET